MRAAGALSLVLLLVAAGCGTTTVTYEPDPNATFKIVLRRAVAGDVLEVTEALSESILQKWQTRTGDVKIPPVVGSGIIRYAETILEAAPTEAAPRRFKRLYSQVQVNDNNRLVAISFVNRPVVFERVGQKYKFEFENGVPVVGPSAGVLDRTVNGPSLAELALQGLLPGREVKLDETWDLAPEQVAQTCGARSNFEVEPAKAKGIGKLVRVYREDGGLKGVLELTVELEPKGTLVPPQPFLPGARVGITMQVDTFIDGSASGGQFKRQRKIKFSRDLDKKGTVAHISISASATTTIKQRPKR